MADFIYMENAYKIMKTSVDSLGKPRYCFHLSVNPLFIHDKDPRKKPKTTRQWEFLVADNLKSFGEEKSAVQSNIRDKHLDKPLRQLHHVLQYTKNLRPEDIDEIFNSKNLESSLHCLIKDSKYNTKDDGLIPYKYDLRASEVARLMTVIGLKYLMHSEKFKDNQNTKSNVEAVLSDFALLSESMFMDMIKKRKEKETLELFSSKLHDRLEKKRSWLEEHSP